MMGSSNEPKTEKDILEKLDMGTNKLVNNFTNIVMNQIKQHHIKKLYLIQKEK